MSNVVKVRVTREDFRKAYRERETIGKGVCQVCVVAQVAIRLGHGNYANADGAISVMTDTDYKQVLKPTDEKPRQLVTMFDRKVSHRMTPEKPDKVYRLCREAGLLNLEYTKAN